MILICVLVTRRVRVAAGADLKEGRPCQPVPASASGLYKKRTVEEDGKRIDEAFDKIFYRAHVNQVGAAGGTRCLGRARWHWLALGAADDGCGYGFELPWLRLALRNAKGGRIGQMQMIAFVFAMAFLNAQRILIGIACAAESGCRLT